MMTRKPFIALLLALPALAGPQEEISSLLNAFLAKVDDPAVHERFWADDLIYVSAAGAVRSKAEILKSMRVGDTPGVRDTKPGEPKTTFSAEEVKVRPLAADVALLNFRLVHHAGDRTNYFRNNGTFVKRDAGGRWSAGRQRGKTRTRNDPMLERASAVDGGASRVQGLARWSRAASMTRPEKR